MNDTFASLPEPGTTEVEARPRRPDAGTLLVIRQRLNSDERLHHPVFEYIESTSSNEEIHRFVSLEMQARGLLARQPGAGALPARHYDKLLAQVEQSAARTEVAPTRARHGGADKPPSISLDVVEDVVDGYQCRKLAGACARLGLPGRHRPEPTREPGGTAAAARPQQARMPADACDLSRAWAGVEAFLERRTAYYDHLLDELLALIPG